MSPNSRGDDGALRVVFVTPFGDDDVGGAPDRAHGLASGLRSAGHDVIVCQLPVRKPLAARRYKPWWYFEPSNEWLDRLAALLVEADLAVASLLPAAHACMRAVMLTRSRSASSRPIFVYSADNDETYLAQQIRPWWWVRQVKAIEDRVLRTADCVWVAGSDDLTRLRHRTPSAGLVDVPAGVGRLPDCAAQRRVLANAFTYGSWSYPPNAEGLTRLASATTQVVGTMEVYGTTSDRLRDSVLRLATASQPLVHWAFRGFEPELARVFGGGGAAVIPLWAGAGTKLRAVQLAGSGVPMVVTPEALSGLPEWFKDAVPVRDDPRELMTAALSDPLAGCAERKSLRARVLEELSWDAIVSRALVAATGPRSSRI